MRVHPHYFLMSLIFLPGYEPDIKNLEKIRDRFAGPQLDLWHQLTKTLLTLLPNPDPRRRGSMARRATKNGLSTYTASQAGASPDLYGLPLA